MRSCLAELPWPRADRVPPRFLRDEAGEGEQSWEDQLARKYYDSLYREYAVCDLKHYKSGNVRRSPPSLHHAR